MSRWKRPLSAREVRQILSRLGFQFREQKGSHEQWVKHTEVGILKVTLAAHNEPFKDTIVRYMAHQARVTVKEFYAALS